MDCKHFRKHHLAYLDDTLPGDLMAKAQHHVLVCDGCAAHDTLVRRSLMVARSMPTLEPSEAFQARLRARLATCREERGQTPAVSDRELYGTPARVTSRTMFAVAASAVLGVAAMQLFGESAAPELSMQPVIASRPAMMSPAPYITPALMQMMATGNPVWPAAMIVDDGPAGFVAAEYAFDMR
jgi:hypothetical protein